VSGQYQRASSGQALSLRERKQMNEDLHPVGSDVRMVQPLVCGHQKGGIVKIGLSVSSSGGEASSA